MPVDTYRVLAEQMAEDKAKEAGMKEVPRAWELVVNSLITASFDLSLDEIESGITDGGADGQVDAMYVLVNGVVLTEEGVENKTFPDKGPVEIDVIIVQSKFADSFEENPLKSVRATVKDLMDLTKDYSTLKFTGYNSSVQSKFLLARHAIFASSGRATIIRCRIYYATKGSTTNIHASVLETGAALAQELGVACATKDTQMVYLGAEEIIEMSRRPALHVRQLAFQELLSHDENSYACLVTVDSLMAFLSDDSGNLIRAMFDANVRDFRHDDGRERGDIRDA